MTSTPRLRNGSSAVSASTMPAASPRVGMMIESGVIGACYLRVVACSFRHRAQGATAARSLSGRAAEAMACHPDWVAIELVGDQLREMGALAATPGQRQVEHLIEVAIIEISAPIDRNQ